MRPIPPTVAQNSSGSRVGPDVDDRAVGEQQRQPVHVAAERAVDVVVLAVDVAGDRPADGDEPGAGGDGHEEAAGHDHPQQVVDADPGADGDGAGGLVEHGGRRRRPARRSTSPPPFWAASPYARPRPRAITPRGGCSLTAIGASRGADGQQLRRCRVGAAPPGQERASVLVRRHDRQRLPMGRDWRGRTVATHQYGHSGTRPPEPAQRRRRRRQRGTP